MSPNGTSVTARARAKARWSPYKDAKVRGLRVIAYIRVSKMDKDKISPEVQLNVIKEYLARLGLVLVATVSDLDLSGRKSDKRSLGKIINRIADGEADGVVVWKISRWGRNHLDSMRHILDLQEAGGYIASATENLDDIETPMGKFSLNTMLAIAQLQSDQIGETWSNIHDYRVTEMQVPATGGPRFGYVYTKSGGQHPGNYRVDRAEPYEDGEGGTNTGEILRECYEKYVSGQSLSSIVRWLDGRAKTSRGSTWTYGPLLNALDSGFGAGKIVRGNTHKNGWGMEYRTWVQGAQEPVISEETWEAYLERRQRPVASRTKSAPYRLANLVYCAGCGRRMVLNHRDVVVDGVKTRKRLMRCYLQGTNPTQSKKCVAPATMHMDRIEEAVLVWLDEHRDQDQEADVAIKRRYAQTAIEANIGDITKDITSAEKRLVNAAKLQASGDMAQFTFKLLEKEELELLHGLRQKLSNAERQQRVNNVPLPGVFEGLHAAWDVLEADVFNEGLRQIISRVYVGRASEPGALARTRGVGGAVRVRVVPQWEAEVEVSDSMTG